MRFRGVLSLVLALAANPVLAQTDGNFHLALPEHSGQLSFSAAGYEVVEHSAKPNGNELGIRGSDATGALHFLAFLFVFSDQAPLTGAKCRDGEMGPEQKASRSLKILSDSEIAIPGALPVALVDYSPHRKRAEHNT
jgi:hypothetical protein